MFDSETVWKAHCRGKLEFFLMVFRWKQENHFTQRDVDALAPFINASIMDESSRFHRKVYAEKLGFDVIYPDLKHKKVPERTLIAFGELNKAMADGRMAGKPMLCADGTPWTAEKLAGLFMGLRDRYGNPVNILDQVSDNN